MQEREERLTGVIDRWIKQSIPNPDWIKLESLFTGIEDGAEEWEIFLHFSKLHRRLPKEAVELEATEREQASELIPGWQPEFWALDELARARFLLTLTGYGDVPFLKLLESLFETGDMRESEALYKSLAILPWPEKLVSRAAEGVRSNITSIYRAVAHHNPYPARWLDEAAWNQMILKALFIEVPLYPVWQVDERRNETLFRMVLDLAHERWAAGRTISPEMWRLASPWIGPDQQDDLDRLLKSQDPLERQALRKICTESEHTELQSILKVHSDLFEDFDPLPSWDEIGRLDEERDETAYA